MRETESKNEVENSTMSKRPLLNGEDGPFGNPITMAKHIPIEDNISCSEHGTPSDEKITVVFINYVHPNSLGKIKGMTENYHSKTNVVKPIEMDDD